jgi:hypothetical protein
MPEGLDAESRAAMIAYFGLDGPLLQEAPTTKTRPRA